MFSIGTILAAFSTNVTELIIFRGIAGLGIGAEIAAVTFLASTTIGLLVPMLYTYTAEQIPTNARATGVALSDGIGHVGGAIAPLVILGAYTAWGFASSLVVMAASGLAAGALILLGIRATGRSLETAAGETPRSTNTPTGAVA